MGKIRVMCSNGTLSAVFFFSSGRLNSLVGRVISWPLPWPFSILQPQLATCCSRNLSNDRPSMLMACYMSMFKVRSFTLLPCKQIISQVKKGKIRAPRMSTVKIWAWSMKSKSWKQKLTRDFKWKEWQRPLLVSSIWTLKFRFGNQWILGR